MLSREELLERQRSISWYHSVDLGDGVVTAGAYDLRPLLPHYGFPEGMSNMSVLDVGRASGFFSFEFERRGARVVATELPSVYDKEYVGGAITSSLVRRWYRRRIGEGADRAAKRDDFFVAHLLLNSKVVPVTVALKDLGPDTLGGERFDLVFVGSVLNHTKDPVGALERVFSVTNENGRCIVANPIDPDDASDTPRLRLVGLSSSSLTGWWLVNVPSLVELMRVAGFHDIEVISRNLVLTRTGSNEKVPHAVVVGWRRSTTDTDRSFAAVMEPSYPGVGEAVSAASTL